MTICINAFMLSGLYTINRDGDDELIEEMKNKLVGKITLELDPAFIMLFGLFTRETTRAESDIDLAYFNDKQLSSYECFIL